MRIEDRECGACGTIAEHVIAEGTVHCMSCGATDSSEPIGDCEIGECPRDATHLVVYNPVGSDRRSEYYCETHAELAAEDAREDEVGDLFYGPAEIE